MPPIQVRTKQMGTAPIGRLLFRLGTPGMISMLIMTLYNLTDTFWVAKLGPDAIAALTILFPYQILLVAIGAGSGAGFSSLISRRFGQGQIQETNHIAGQVFLLTFGFGLIFCFLTTFAVDPVLHFFGTTPDIHVYSRDYLMIIGSGVFFVFFSMISNNILRGSGNTLAPMIFMATAAVLNIILDPFLIFGIGFFPAWGIKGAAIATIFSQFVSFIAGLIYLLKHSGYHIRWEHLSLDFSILSDIYQVGFPTFIMQCVGSFIVIIINHILGSYGFQAIAAFGVVVRLMHLIVMPIAGLSQGLMPIAGYNYGAKQPQRLWQAVKIASLASFSIIGFGYISLQLFPEFWITLFTHDQSFLPLATHAVRLATLTLPLMGPPFMWITTLQALGQGRSVMIISLSRQLLFLPPLLYILPKFYSLNGVWLSLPLSDTLSFLLAGIWILHEYHRQKQKYLCTQNPINVYPAATTPPDWIG